MKRRDWLRNAISGSALAAAASAPVPVAAQTPPPTNQDTPKLKLSTPDAVGEVARNFFSPVEFATLKALAAALVPAVNGRPGSVEAEVPEFLDFLLSQSPADRKDLYQKGLAALAAQSFASLSPAEAAKLLAPLGKPWTYAGPADPLERFLRAAKDDILQATTNSQQWAAANRSSRGGGSPTNYYYFPIE